MLLTLLVFLALLFPYLQESYEKYGSHFYNVNTTFYVWYDSWEEARTGTLAAGDDVGFPDLPPEELPGLEKYLREHTLQQVIERFVNGANKLVSYGCLYRDSTLRYDYCGQVAAGLVMFAFGLPLVLRRFAFQQIIEIGQSYFFAIVLFLTYVPAALRYAAITGPDPRFVMALIVPFFWILGLLTHSARLQEHRITYGRTSVRTVHPVYGLFSLALVIEICLLVAFRAGVLRGGN